MTEGRGEGEAIEAVGAETRPVEPPVEQVESATERAPEAAAPEAPVEGVPFEEPLVQPEMERGGVGEDAAAVDLSGTALDTGVEEDLSGVTTGGEIPGAEVGVPEIPGVEDPFADSGPSDGVPGGPGLIRPGTPGSGEASSGGDDDDGQSWWDDESSDDAGDGSSEDDGDEPVPDGYVFDPEVIPRTGSDENPIRFWPSQVYPDVEPGGQEDRQFDVDTWLSGEASMPRPDGGGEDVPLTVDDVDETQTPVPVTDPAEFQGPDAGSGVDETVLPGQVTDPPEYAGGVDDPGAVRPIQELVTDPAEPESAAVSGAGAAMGEEVEVIPINLPDPPAPPDAGQEALTWPVPIPDRAGEGFDVPVEEAGFDDALLEEQLELESRFVDDDVADEGFPEDAT